MGYMTVLLDLGMVTSLQILSIDHSDCYPLILFRPHILATAEQLRNVVSLHDGCLEWCPIPFFPDVLSRVRPLHDQATTAQPGGFPATTKETGRLACCI